MNARIALPFSEGTVFQHFGHSTQFKIYEVVNDEVVSSEVLETGCQGHDDLSLWLVQQSVEIVICGDIGPAAFGALTAAGIRVFAGLEGTADEAVRVVLTVGFLEAASPNCGHGAGSCCGGGCGGHEGCGCHGCRGHA